MTCHRRRRPWRRPHPAAARGFLGAGPAPAARGVRRVAPPLYKGRAVRSARSAAVPRSWHHG
ncbi:unnamed protein product, partial [Bubo scandiacus]